MKYANFDAAWDAAMSEACKVLIPGETRDIETETESFHECSWELRKGGEKVGSLTVERSDGVEEVTLQYGGETYVQ